MSSYLDKTGLTYLWGKIKSYVSSLILQPDWDQIDATANDYIKNKPAIPDEIVVDSALSDFSENPVQSKVIKAALNNKVAKTGDTMTDCLEICRVSGNVDTGLFFQRTDTEVPLYRKARLR